MREQDVIDGVIIGEKVIFDWEVADGPTDIAPLDQQPPIRGSQHPLAKKDDYFDGEYTVHKDEPEDPMKRLLVFGCLATLATAVVSVFSGNKPETQSPSTKPEFSGLSLDDSLASLRQTLDNINQQGLTIPTPQTTDLLARIAQLAENPSEVAPEIAKFLSPPSVFPVQSDAGPAVSAAPRPPEVKPNPEFLNRVRVVAAEIPPVVAPVHNLAPILRAVPWNEAPLALRQQVSNPEAFAAPSLEQLQTAFTGLINGLAQGDSYAIEGQTAWFRKNAPSAVQPLVESLTGSANELITLENAGVLYPTPFVLKLIETIHQLDPTTPEGKILLDRAFQFQQLHLDKLARDAQEMIDAARAIQTFPQTIELPQAQAVISPYGIHFLPPPDVVNNLVSEPAKDGGGLILGPLPGLRFAICPSDPLGKLVASTRVLAGLQPLGPFRYTIQRIEKFGNIVPASLRGSKLGWLNDLADRIPITYAEIIPKPGYGLFGKDGLGPPVYMLYIGDLRVGDEIGFNGVVDGILKSLGVNP